MDAEVQNPSLEETLGNPDKIGPFTVDPKEQNAALFAQMVTKRFEANKGKLGFINLPKEVKLSEVPPEQAKAIIKLLQEGFAAEHQAKFGLLVHGIFSTSNFDNLVQALNQESENLVFHGTDATRGELILTEGFTVPKDRKVDQYPMYGVGVSATPVSSKACPYFQEKGYSSRERAEGMVFVLNPKRGNVHKSAKALWGNTIYTPHGSEGDWRDYYDSVEAIPKDKGGDQGASNFPELTLKNGEQAHPVAVVWAELVPSTDPDYKKFNLDKNPVKDEILKPLESMSAPVSFLTEKLEELVKKAEKKAASAATNPSENEDLLKELGFEVVKIVDAKAENGLKMEYEFANDISGGIELAPDQAVLVNLPNFDGDLRNIVIRHRKSEKRWYADRTPRRWMRIQSSEVKQDESGNILVRRRGTDSWYKLDPKMSHLVSKGGGTYNERDSNPAKTAIYVHDVATNRWILLETKIGEPRPPTSPEEERLYDLPFRGKVDKVLLVGKGEGDQKLAITNLHGVEVVNYPDLKGLDLESIEQIFTRGMRFFDPKDPERKESYQPIDNFGNPRWGYPNSVVIGGEMQQPFNTFPKALISNPKEEMYLSGGDLHIKLPPGKKLKSVEVACGDMEYGSSPSQNKNGWAELEVDVVSKIGGNKLSAISRESVPPYGILSGAPDGDSIIEEGDEMVIKAVRHPAWVMGYRILVS